MLAVVRKFRSYEGTVLLHHVRLRLGNGLYFLSLALLISFTSMQHTAFGMPL